MVKLKYKTKRKIERIYIKLNRFIEDVICYPINIVNKKIKTMIKKRRNKLNTAIYQYLVVPDCCFVNKSKEVVLK